MSRGGSQHAMKKGRGAGGVSVEEAGGSEVDAVNEAVKPEGQSDLDTTAPHRVAPQG